MQSLPIIWLESVDSTQEEAKRQIAAGKITQNCILVAEEQTGGKGTQGRYWHSPKNKGLYITLVHFDLGPNLQLEITPFYTQACALACVKALQDCYDLTPQVKPINDIYFEGRKLGGILVESASLGNSLQYILTGIGINFAPFDSNDDDATELFTHQTIQPISLTEIITDSCSLLIPKSALIYSLSDACNYYYQQLLIHGEQKISEKLDPLLLS